MLSTFLPFAAMFVGIVALVWGADRFVDGAAAIAQKFNVPNLVIGLTIVALGTSAPEILVSIVASLQGNGGLAVGNALGSNITNIGLVIGIAAMVAPIGVSPSLLRKELPLLVLISFAVLYLLFDLQYTPLESAYLLAGLLLFLIWLGYNAKNSNNDALEAEDQHFSTAKAVAIFVAGLTVLLLGSQSLVWGAVTTAKAFGVSDSVIGLTIVALGTSLPELAATIGSVLKKKYDIAIGNVVGSNIFNLLAVLGVAGIAGELSIDASMVKVDIPIMLALTLALCVMGISWKKQGRINRFEGSMLLAAWLSWQAWTWATAMA